MTHPPAGPSTPTPPPGPPRPAGTRIDRALRLVRTGLLIALLGAAASVPIAGAGHSTHILRPATPAESLLHDLYAERDMAAAEREAQR